MKTGTTALKAEAGSWRRRIAPQSPPSPEAEPSTSARLPWPASSARYPWAPESDPGTSPTVLETFATTGA